MLDYTGNFKDEIKSNIREVGIKIGFRKNDKDYFLSGDDLQKHTYKTEIKKELGGVIRKVVNITLMSTETTKLLTKGDSFNLFYTTPNGECKVDILFINSVKTNDKNQLIDIEALDYLSYIKDNPMPFIRMDKNTTLLDYLDKLLKILGIDFKIKGDVLNPRIKLAYLNSNSLQNVLEEMGMALNALFVTKTNSTFGARLPLTIPFSFTDSVITDSVFIEIRPFKATEPVEILNFNNCLLDVISDDNIEKYDRVSISVFNPSSSNNKNLGELRKQVPAMTKNVDIGIAEFNKPCMPQVIHFDEEIEVVEFDISTEKASFKVNTKDILNADLNLDFQGSEFNILSNYEKSSSKTKIVNSMYIQSPNIYDSRIYLGNEASIKYTGNPLLEVGDTILINDIKVLITEHGLTYTGGLRGTLKGVIINEYN